eukprot:1653572-Pleurochrysis_carterae.AAC.4
MIIDVLTPTRFKYGISIEQGVPYSDQWYAFWLGLVRDPGTWQRSTYRYSNRLITTQTSTKAYRRQSHPRARPIAIPYAIDIVRYLKRSSEAC